MEQNRLLEPHTTAVQRPRAFFNLYINNEQRCFPAPYLGKKLLHVSRSLTRRQKGRSHNKYFKQIYFGSWWCGFSSHNQLFFKYLLEYAYRKKNKAIFSNFLFHNQWCINNSTNWIILFSYKFKNWQFYVT